LLFFYARQAECIWRTLLVRGKSRGNSERDEYFFVGQNRVLLNELSVFLTGVHGADSIGRVTRVVHKVGESCPRVSKIQARSEYTASMAKKIYVGNLSFQTTEADLSTMFEAIGEVESVQIITDRDTGRSKGFGFVQMSDDAAAEKAIAQLNGKEVGGRSLTVNEARPVQKRDFGGGRGGGGGGRRRY
jgi:hypothetical protein